MFLLLMAGCSGDETGSSPTEGHGSLNHAPSIRSAHLQPNLEHLSGPVSVQVGVNDPDQDPVTFTYLWFVNGTTLDGQTGSSLDPALLHRGDLVSVEIVPSDGKTEGAPFRTQPVLVGEPAPVITAVTYDPSEPRVGDRIRAQIEVAAKSRAAYEYTFRWWRNGTLFNDGEQEAIDTTGFSPGDEIRVEVTPSDSTVKGQLFLASPVKIVNSLPQITSSPPAPEGRGAYRYALTAMDPDGDPLTYVLQIGPPGMTIEERTGVVHWTITPEMKGTHRVKVVVNDSRGGWASQEFDFNLSDGSAPAPKPSS